jgi:hypothetical protein
MRTLDDMGPSKLQAAEQASVREAADALFFSESGVDGAAREALDHTRALVARLVDSDRWSEERAAELAADLEACGPGSLVASS